MDYSTGFSQFITSFRPRFISKYWYIVNRGRKRGLQAKASQSFLTPFSVTCSKRQGRSMNLLSLITVTEHASPSYWADADSCFQFLSSVVPSPGKPVVRSLTRSHPPCYIRSNYNKPLSPSQCSTEPPFTPVCAVCLTPVLLHTGNLQPTAEWMKKLPIKSQ